MSTHDISFQLDRILHLIQLLGKESLSAPQIVERLNTYYERSRERMVRIDIRLLNHWGFHIKTRRNPARYELLYNPLTGIFDEHHIEALATIRHLFPKAHPLGASFERLLDTLLVGLDDEQRALYNQPLPLRMALKLATSYSKIQQFLPTIKHAITTKHQLQFVYQSLDGEPLHHVVDPYEINYEHQHLYLVAYSNRTRQITDFRLDRIVPEFVASLGTTINDPERDLYPYVFRYRMVAKLAQRGVSERFMAQRIVQTFENGDVEIEARARSEFYAVRGLLRYADSVTATFPPTLINELRATLGRMIAQYTD